jgi:hypothetical protein
MANINISASDRRNTASTKTIPFIYYKVPRIELHAIDNAIRVDDTIIIMPPKSVLQFKISSPIGLSKVAYSIDSNTKEISLNGEREYILSIEIAWVDTPD